MVDVGSWLAENPHPIRGTLIPLLNERVGDPVREAWEDRPWWLHWRDHWRWIVWMPLKPDFSTMRSKFVRRIESEELARRMAVVARAAPYLDVEIEPHPILSSQIRVTVPIDESVEEIRPLVQPWLDLGWETTSTRDSWSGRMITLEHESWEVDIFFRAKVGRGSACEVIEHEVEKTETEYEVVCAGEKEIREAAGGS